VGKERGKERGEGGGKGPHPFKLAGYVFRVARGRRRKKGGGRDDSTPPRATRNFRRRWFVQKERRKEGGKGSLALRTDRTKEREKKERGPVLLSMATRYRGMCPGEEGKEQRDRRFAVVGVIFEEL